MGGIYRKMARSTKRDIMKENKRLVRTGTATLANLTCYECKHPAEDHSEAGCAHGCTICRPHSCGHVHTGKGEAERCPDRKLDGGIPSVPGTWADMDD